MTEFISLPETYHKYGYDFELLERDGDVAIFKQIDEGKVIAFEVVEVLKQKEWTAFGKTIPAKEAIPSTESWGVNAFTCRTKGEARKKAEWLKNRLSENREVRDARKIQNLTSYKP